MSAESEKIDNYIADAADWQADNLKYFRKLVHQVDADVQEGWKWDVPVFMVGGKLVCAMSVFKDHTKFNFFEGALLSDPHGLFNSGLESKKHRSINLEQGQQVDEAMLLEIITAAVARAKISSPNS